MDGDASFSLHSDLLFFGLIIGLLDSPGPLYQGTEEEPLIKVVVIQVFGARVDRAC